MLRFDPDQPFVLLDSGTAGDGAQLFTRLGDVIAATTGDEVRPALDRLRTTTGHRAGFIGFDAGYALEATLASRLSTAGDGLPLLWFGVFARAVAADPNELLAAEACDVGPLTCTVRERDYAACVASILEQIAAGDLYQANITFQASVALTGTPLALYRRLRIAAAAPFGALVNTGSAWLLSLSPELFFRLRHDEVTTRPIKGPPGAGTPQQATMRRRWRLRPIRRISPRNLMIVDLLRNDLARIAEPGLVRVPALFAIERYPTLLQITSTVTAVTRCDAVEVLGALFPCGSVTGAPKIAAMHAIAEVEGVGRGVYTGSIGAIDAAGDAVFNVAIRTLVITCPTQASIGLGAGIVADSIAADEWLACLAKAAFLHRDMPS